MYEMVHAFEKATEKTIPCEVIGHRPGDAARVYGAAIKTEKELGWKAVKTLEEGCRDSWN